MMFVLNDIIGDVEFSCYCDVTGCFAVIGDQASQNPQAERVVAVGFTGGFDLGACAANPLRSEEGDCIFFLHGL